MIKSNRKLLARTLFYRPCGATDSCTASKGICSFPAAHVQLTKRQQLLMAGQPYKIHLDLDMPESPTNRELGKYISTICVNCRFFSLLIQF